jgi:hypothetical protein
LTGKQTYFKKIDQSDNDRHDNNDDRRGKAIFVCREIPAIGVSSLDKVVAGETNLGTTSIRSAEASSSSTIYSDRPAGLFWWQLLAGSLSADWHRLWQGGPIAT